MFASGVAAGVLDRLVMAVSWSCAAGKAVPGASRATTSTNVLVAGSHGPPKSSSSKAANGAQKDGRNSVGPVKSVGRTPTTVTGEPFSHTVLPTADGSPLSRADQK